MIFHVGQRVHSKAVGRRVAFDGEVRQRSPGGLRYVVRDDDGRRWLRDESELSEIARDITERKPVKITERA